MIAKIHNTADKKKIIAICDDELLGNVFIDNEKQLDLTGSFFKGKRIALEDLKKEIKSNYLINAVGKKTIETLTDLGLIDKKYVLKIKDIPYVQVMISEK